MTHARAATAPGREAGTYTTRDHPVLGTTPALTDVSLAPTRPTAHTGPRAPRLACRLTSRPKPSPSKTGAGTGPLRKTCSGSSSAGEPGEGVMFRTAR